MSTAAIPAYQPRKGATAEFTSTSIVIERAYKVGGKYYDITYDTDNATLQKLRGMEPQELVQTFQAQMGAYLRGAKALSDPVGTSFEVTDKEVLVQTPGKPKYSISDETTNKVAKAFSETLGTIDDPADDDNPLEEPLKKSFSGAIEGVRITAGTMSKLNLLTYGPVPNLSSITGGATLASGLIGVGQQGYQAYSAFKDGKTSEGMESVIKTAGAGAEVVTGIAALGAGPATMGPIACAIAAGSNLLINFKDLYLCAFEDKPLPDNFGWSFVSNMAMFIGPVLLLAGALSNPYVALGVLLGLAVIALTGFIMANRGALAEMLNQMEWWERILFAAPIIISISLSVAGVPNAMWIGLGVSVGAAILNLVGKKFLKDPPQPNPIEAEDKGLVGSTNSESEFSETDEDSGSDTDTASSQSPVRMVT